MVQLECDSHLHSVNTNTGYYNQHCCSTYNRKVNSRSPQLERTQNKNRLYLKRRQRAIFSFDSDLWANVLYYFHVGGPPSKVLLLRRPPGYSAVSFSATSSFFVSLCRPHHHKVHTHLTTLQTREEHLIWPQMTIQHSMFNSVTVTDSLKDEQTYSTLN